MPTYQVNYQYWHPGNPEDTTMNDHMFVYVLADDVNDGRNPVRYTEVVNREWYIHPLDYTECGRTPERACVLCFNYMVGDVRDGYEYRMLDFAEVPDDPRALEAMSLVLPIESEPVPVPSVSNIENAARELNEYIELAKGDGLSNLHIAQLLDTGAERLKREDAAANAHIRTAAQRLLGDDLFGTPEAKS
jgi:hypothetical protein